MTEEKTGNMTGKMGHHIYTRSWFELGSRTPNAGTFTVELTSGIFGAKTDDIVYNRLNPICATVPEALAPLNSGRSILRVFHPLPDTTVINRLWYVTDAITGRGPVPYAHSLIFRGNEKNDINDENDINETFLLSPQKAFEPNAMEPYESFCARVNPNSPIPTSDKYDPQYVDYMLPYSLSQREWIDNFGFNKERFANFFVSLGRAVCVTGSSKVCVVLPVRTDNMAPQRITGGEELILATLSILPMFMKKKFGAASNWKDSMDGNPGRALSNMQLICCYGEPPYSDSKFTIIDLTRPALTGTDLTGTSLVGTSLAGTDLTGTGGFDRVETLSFSDKIFGEWVWDNIDKPKELDKFEAFMKKNFTEGEAAVLGKMPFYVVASCFLLWSRFGEGRTLVKFESAVSIAKLITESFAKNYKKFPFIHTCLNDCMQIIEDGLMADIKDKLEKKLPDYIVAAICMLANNGDDRAKQLLTIMHNHSCMKADWKNVAATTTYYAEFLELSSKTRVTAADADAVGSEGVGSAGVASAYGGASTAARAGAGVVAGASVYSDPVRFCRERLNECLKYTDPTVSKIAADALNKYCVSLRYKGLKTRDNNEFRNIFDEYEKVVNELDYHGKLSASLFRSPDIDSFGAIYPDTAENYLSISIHDVKKLGYIPVPAYWNDARVWLDPLVPKNNKLKKELFELYLRAVPEEKKHEYMREIVSKYDQLPPILMSFGNPLRVVTGKALVEKFAKLWQESAFDLSSDETWDFVDTWQKKLESMGIETSDGIFEAIRQTIKLDHEGLLEISGILSPEAIRIITNLYNDAGPKFESSYLRIKTSLIIFEIIDEAASAKTVKAEMSYPMINTDGYRLADWQKRMDYWYDKGFDNPSEWALLMIAALKGSVRFDPKLFFALCRTKTGVKSVKKEPEDVICVFNGLRVLEKYPQNFKVIYLEVFENMVRSLLRDSFPEELFFDRNVRDTFSKLSPEISAQFGKFIIGELLKIVGKISPDISDSYYKSDHKSSSDMIKEMPREHPIISAGVVVMALLLIFAGIACLFVGKGLIAPVLGTVGSFTHFILFGLTALLLIFNSITYIMYANEKGDRSL